MTCALLEAVQRLQEATEAEAVSKAKGKHAKKLRRIVVRMFREQSRALQTHLQPHLKRLFEAEVNESLIRLLAVLLASNERNWAESMASVIADAFLEGLRDEKTSLNGSFDIPTDVIERRIRTYAAEMIAGINETTRNEVRNMLELGLRERWSYSKIASELKKKFREFAAPSSLRHIKDRATLIAVTEIGQAYTDGQAETARTLQAMGIDMEKAWLTVGDDRVSEDCSANEAEGWIPFAQSFSSGHQWPLDHPGCRCSLLQRRAE